MKNNKKPMGVYLALAFYALAALAGLFFLGLRVYAMFAEDMSPWLRWFLLK